MFFVLFACTKKDLDVVIKQEKINVIYQQNNLTASTRFQSIAYDTTEIPKERFKVVHISDAHLSAYSVDNHYTNPNNLIESVRFANQPELRVNAMLSTGDNISNSYHMMANESMLSFYEHLYKDNTIPTYSCYGNHDSNMPYSDDLSAVLQRSELFEHMRRNMQINEIYYYKDLPNPMGGTVRIISLNMLDQAGTEFRVITQSVYSQEQIDWLGNVALKEGMTPSHSVIILNHFPFQRTTEDLATFLCDGGFVNGWEMVPEIIEAFRLRRKWEKTYKNNNKPEVKPIVASFDFSQAKGEFICYLGGHAHVYAHFNVKDFEGESSILKKQQMILATNMAPSDKGKVFNKVERVDSTTSSNAFNLYAIDTNVRKIYITFFGAYIPQGETNYPAIQVLDY